MTPEMWTTLLILTKFLVYLGMAGAIGGSVSLFLFTHDNALPDLHEAIKQWQHSICRYAFVLLSIGFVANAADFFVQTGNMSETGIFGMFDSFMLEMLWMSSVGTITVVRAIFFALSAIMMLTVFKTSHSLQSTRNLIVYGACTAFIAVGLSYSFTLSGHTKELAFGSITLIMLHVSIAFAWVGSLLPLVYATTIFRDKELSLIMTRFGVYATGLVTSLLVAGSGMFIQLVASIEALFTTPYGQLFIAKVALVLSMLGFAVWHKLYLIPRLLQQESGHISLKRSIRVEAAVGLLVLITTSVVTTAVGPSF
jgi:putative copper resistance protein D